MDCGTEGFSNVFYWLINWDSYLQLMLPRLPEQPPWVGIQGEEDHSNLDHSYKDIINE